MSIEFQNGKPITNADAFKRAIRAEPASAPTRTRKAKKAAPTVEPTRSRQPKGFEESRETVRELATLAREHGWEATAGWSPNNGGVAKVNATRGTETASIRFERGQPTSSVDAFRRKVTR